MKRTVIGTVAGLASMAVLTIAMIPLRSHLSIATTALVLVVPVVIGVVSGGFLAGVLSVVAGFLVYWYFIPPIHTLWVGAPQNWAALGVYAVVMLPVAHVVARLNVAREQARGQEKEIRELFQLSDLLVEEIAGHWGGHPAAYRPRTEAPGRAGRRASVRRPARDASAARPLRARVRRGAQKAHCGDSVARARRELATCSRYCQLRPAGAGPHRAPAPCRPQHAARPGRRQKDRVR
jgi:hypothetical protein